MNFCQYEEKSDYRRTGCAPVQGQEHLWSWDYPQTSAEDLNFECISGQGKLKRAVIPVMLGNLDFYGFEVALEGRGHYFPLSVAVSVVQSLRAAQLEAVPVLLAQMGTEDTQALNDPFPKGPAATAGATEHFGVSGALSQTQRHTQVTAQGCVHGTGGTCSCLSPCQAFHSRKGLAVPSTAGKAPGIIHPPPGLGR